MAQPTLRDYLQQTEDAISANRIEHALANCQQILSYFPEFLEAQRLLGEVYLKQGYLEEAQQTFDWVLINDPENVVAYCNRALISEKKSDFDTALDCYQQAYELSRGNGAIRQRFNDLSNQIGQQGFMFSRAGLARLYMRGDLLSQAIQEWETVLTVNPDRLDARTGLLEAFWREGFYEQVQELAAQLLEDIPNCLKALLLLAYVTFPNNREQARELLAQAATLDPEMVMAQELFADLLASQPDSAFLTLLRREPIPFPPAPADQPDATVPPTAYRPEQASLAVSPGTDLPPEALFTWSSMDTLVEPLKSQPEPDSDADPAVTQDQAFLAQQSWYQMNQSEASSVETVTPGSTSNSFASAPLNGVGSTEQQAEVPPTPPAWLDMLTKTERLLPRTPSAPLPAKTEAPPLAQPQEHVSTPPPSQPLPPEPEPESEPTLSYQMPSPSQEEEIMPFPFASEDEDADMGWPEWLKSLGAATMDDNTTPLVAEVAPISPPGPTPQLESSPLVLAEATAAPVEFPQSAAATELPEPEPEPTQAWQDQLDQPPVDEEQEHQLLATLEELDDDLRSQGFVPLEPGVLSTFAQEASLSSAFADLGTFAPTQAQPQPNRSAEVESMPLAPATPAPTPPVQPQPIESLWPAVPIYNQVLEPASPDPASSEVAAEIPAPALGKPSVAPDVWAGPTPNTAFSPASAPQPELVPVAVPEPAIHLAETQTQSLSQGQNQTPDGRASASLSGKPLPLPYSPLSAGSLDALLDTELETTMKRPAIRLQPMQLPSTSKSQGGLMSKGRSTEPSLAPTNKPTDTSDNDKERLLRGYQYQLAGAYDSAMQEYRVLIRSAPKQLSEVISNMRALLKLAPKYSAGYRVLGDAYMRQGEYLQAMEAYNKALSMAKKAKG